MFLNSQKKVPRLDVPTIVLYTEEEEAILWWLSHDCEMIQIA